MIRTITPIFSIVIAVAIFFLYTEPKFAVIKQIQGEAKQYSAAVEKAEQRNQHLNEKHAQKRAHSPENLERLEALVPTSIDEVKVLTDLSELAKKHNMLFGNVSVTNNDSEYAPPTTANDQFVEYGNLTYTDIDFSLIGTYEQYKQFLADVESSLVMLEVQDISFSTGEGLFQQYKMMYFLNRTDYLL